MNPLGEWLFLAVPARAGLRQGRGVGVELVEAMTAGAFSLAAHHLHEQPGCPVAHTAREVLLPSHVIKLLARHVDTLGEQPVGQRPVQRPTMLGQPTVLLGGTNGGPLGRARLLPVAPSRFMGAVGVEAVGRTGTVLAIHVALSTAQPHGVQLDPTGQRVNPSRRRSITALHRNRDFTRAEVEGDPAVADRMPLLGCPSHTSCMR